MEEIKFTVKLSKLIEDFKLEKMYITPNGDEVEIVTPDVNRPSLQLT